MRALLRDRNFRLLAIGQLLNMFGDRAMFFALAIWVKSLTGSSAQAGLVFLTLSAPALAAPLFGMAVDRVPRRLLLIANDAAIALVVLALLAVHDRGDVWVIFAVALIYGMSGQLYFSARSGLLVSMLPEEQLGDANGLLSSAGEGVQIAAPLVGAALFALFGGGAVAIFDSATFVLSVVFLLALKVRDLERRSERQRFWPELTAGARHILGVPDLRRLIGVTAGVLIAVGIMNVTIFEVIDKGLHRSPSFLGVMGAIQGAGAIVGGVVAGPMLRRLGELRLAGVSLALAAVGILPFAAPRLYGVIPASIVVGCAVALFLVAYQTLLQRRTPEELQGRVFSGAEAVTSVPFTLSNAVGAALVTVIDYRLVYVVGAAAFGLGAVALLRTSRSAQPHEIAASMSGE